MITQRTSNTKMTLSNLRALFSQRISTLKISLALLRMNLKNLHLLLISATNHFLLTRLTISLKFQMPKDLLIFSQVARLFLKQITWVMENLIKRMKHLQIKRKRKIPKRSCNNLVDLRNYFRGKLTRSKHSKASLLMEFHLRRTRAF